MRNKQKKLRKKIRKKEESSPWRKWAEKDFFTAEQLSLKWILFMRDGGNGKWESGSRIAHAIVGEKALGSLSDPDCIIRSHIPEAMPTCWRRGKTAPVMPMDARPKKGAEKTEIETETAPRTPKGKAFGKSLRRSMGIKLPRIKGKFTGCTVQNGFRARKCNTFDVRTLIFWILPSAQQQQQP